MIAIMSDDLFRALRGMAGPVRRLPAGTALFRAGDAPAALHLVVDGCVELRRHRADGRAVVLQRAGPGDLVAEASLFAPRYHCDAEAATDCAVASAPLRAVEDRLAEPGFARALAAHLAAAVQAARFRAELLAVRSVGERLDMWLDWTGGDLPPRGSRRRLADELGVAPEALYRELALRRGARGGAATAETEREG
jgi:CRP-like cAMP-binding protein